MIPAIKTYKIDYEFIIKNYTDPRLWDKIWTLLEYKKYVFTLSLDNIDVKKKQIGFEIKLSSDLDIWNRSVSSRFRYDTQNMNIQILKNLINSNMKDLIEILEKNKIEDEEEYRSILDGWDKEEKMLISIANDFLDENNVSNKEIREAYVDYYVGNNDFTGTYLNDYINEAKYTRLVDLYLIVAELTNDEELREKVIESQSNDISKIVKEVENFMEYLESNEYMEEMQDKLERI